MSKVHILFTAPHWIVTHDQQEVPFYYQAVNDTVQKVDASAPQALASEDAAVIIRCPTWDEYDLHFSALDEREGRESLRTFYSSPAFSDGLPSPWQRNHLRIDEAPGLQNSKEAVYLGFHEGLRTWALDMSNNAKWVCDVPEGLIKAQLGFHEVTFTYSRKNCGNLVYHPHFVYEAENPSTTESLVLRIRFA